MTVYICNREKCKEGFCADKAGGYCSHTTDVNFAKNKTGPWTFIVTGAGHLFEAERKESAS